MTTDATLLQAFRSGDEAAFATLAERYQPAIRAACQRQAPLGEVDDCVQAVFLVLARRSAAAARSPVLLAWLHRVAHFVCRDARRAATRRKRTVRAVAQPPSGGHRPEAAVLDQLDAALLRLEERQRVAVLLHACGNATDDIAERLGVTTANASKLVQRGLATLRERLCRTGTPIGAAALVTLIGTGGTAAADVAIPSLSLLLAQTSTTKAALLANGAAMHLTIAIAKPWIIAATLVAALGTGGIIAADAVKPPVAPTVVEVPANKLDQQLDTEVTLDLQDTDLVDAVKMLQKLTAVTFIVDPKVVAANPPPVTLRVEKMKVRYALEFIMKLTGLKYRIDGQTIFITNNEPLAEAAQEKPAAAKQDAPPEPIINLKVTNMHLDDATKWMSEIAGVPITVDARLKNPRVTFEFQDMSLTDSLEFLAKLTSGEVQPLGGGNAGYQIVPKATEADHAPAAPSAAQ